MPRSRAPDRVLGPYYDKRRDEHYLLIVGWEGDNKAKSRRRFPSKEAAATEKDRLEAELKAAEETTVQQAIERWLAFQRDDRGNGEYTLDCYRRELYGLFPPAERELLLRSLTPARAERLYRELVDRPVLPPKLSKDPDRPSTPRPRAVATHQGALATAKWFCAWASSKKVGLLPKGDPFAGVEPVGGAPNKGKAKLREDEVLRYWDTALERAARDPMKIIPLLPVAMGMRAGEILTLRVRSLQLGASLCYVEEEGKTGERRYKVPAELRPALLALAEGRPAEEWLLGWLRTEEWLRYQVKALARAAGVPYRCPQGLRATHEEMAIEAGDSPETVAASVGHTRAVQRQHYVSPSAFAAGAQHRVLAVIEGGRARRPAPDIVPPIVPQPEEGGEVSTGAA